MFHLSLVGESKIHYAQCLHGKKVWLARKGYHPTFQLSEPPSGNIMAPQPIFFVKSVRVGVVWRVTRRSNISPGKHVHLNNLAVVCIAAYRSQETHRKPDRAWLHGKRQRVPQPVPLCGVTVQRAFTCAALLQSPIFMCHTTALSGSCGWTGAEICLVVYC